MVDRIVLQVELANPDPLRQPVGFYQRRTARVEAGSRLSFDWKELAIPPQVLRARFNFLAGDILANRRVVVCHFERTEALVAHPERFGGESRFTEMTL